ncbi:unnamed protein product [Spirodela intermedia]|uniref:Uncharacterized protein n=1 Tax=Spirodela intermedia TaxID=51605 RepID=A0ABN7EA30_SPIIN|nr:unnamed protein product [Spirodela intermedia]
MEGIEGLDTCCTYDRCPVGIVGFGLWGTIVSSPLGVDIMCPRDGGRKGRRPILFLGHRLLPLDFFKISLLGSPWIGPRLSWVSPSGPPLVGHLAPLGHPVQAPLGLL